MHTKQSQGGEGKAQKESGVAEEDGRQTAEGAENRVNKNKRQETAQGDKISRIKDRGEQKKQRGQCREQKHKGYKVNKSKRREASQGDKISKIKDSGE